MTFEGLLFGLIVVTLPLDWVVVAILIRAAHKRPRIRALTVMAILTGIIATALSAYVWAVFNAGAGYVFPKEIAQIAFRLVLVSLGIFPVWFLWLYRTGRFRDGEPGS